MLGTDLLMTNIQVHAKPITPQHSMDAVLMEPRYALVLCHSVKH